MTDRGRSRTYLRKLGDDAEQCVDIAQAALHLAALTRSQPDLRDAEKHLAALRSILDEEEPDYRH